ncbi:hypothetical protein [Rhizobium sp. P38BS-XIX]|uniref:hypothetical protein n=1 Tax=Rhizobium sp. P38BS-XIX TaxID=2726740 RepID=UPI00197D6DE1|nr:hypothetical protein [Rhizobium sp. P38BS-XIX]
MNLLKSIIAELLGMFIDDGALALLSLALIIVIAIAVYAGLFSGFIAALILLMGCILILAESLTRAARNWRQR